MSSHLESLDTLLHPPKRKSHLTAVPLQERERVKIYPKVTAYTRLKYAVDQFMATLGLIAISPFLAIVAILVKLDSKGPVFFKHERIGLGASPFMMYKFRTMIENAHQLQAELQQINEMKGGALFKADKDPRITRLGRFLRKYSIDELPQLFNIARGDMSFIGPRPISTPLDYYKPEELKRFSVKPGLGCIWQAYFRKETDFRMWIKTDLMYVDELNVWLDTKLFFKILVNSIKGRGAR